MTESAHGKFRLFCGVLALGFALACGGSGGSATRPAKPVTMGGAALTLDVLSATDDQGAPCTIHARSSAHVTIICLKADQTQLKAEVDRFVKDVTPYLPEMIEDVMLAQFGKAGPVALVGATFTKNLFNVGIKGYEPEPGSRAALIQLNQKLTDFVHGAYAPTGAGPTGGLGPYDLQVEATTKPGRGSYTPHLTVTAPSTYKSSKQPVHALNATLRQALAIRYYAY